MLGNDTVCALDITYTDPELGPMRELAVGMTKNNRVYFFQYFTDSSEYGKYYPIVSKILNQHDCRKYSQQDHGSLSIESRWR